MTFYYAGSSVVLCAFLMLVYLIVDALMIERNPMRLRDDWKDLLGLSLVAGVFIGGAVAFGVKVAYL